MEQIPEAKSARLLSIYARLLSGQTLGKTELAAEPPRLKQKRHIVLPSIEDASNLYAAVRNSIEHQALGNHQKPKVRLQIVLAVHRRSHIGIA